MVIDQSILREAGIDYALGVSRMMNDAGFYESLLRMFLNDDSFERARAAHAAGDLRGLFECAHELKGVSGNAALTGIYTAADRLVALLRSDAADNVRLDEAFGALESAYTAAREGIRAALADCETDG